MLLTVFAVNISAAEENSDSGSTSQDAWTALIALLNTSENGASAPVGTRGRFEQRRTSMLLADPLVSTGRFAVVAGYARFDTEMPTPSIMLVEPETVTLVDLQAETVERYDRDADPEMPPDPATDLLGLLLARDLERLQTVYHASSGSPEHPDAAAFVLTPKTSVAEGSKTVLPGVSIEFGRDAGEPRRLEIVQPDGDTLQLRFTDLEYDAALSPERLRDDIPPAGTDS